MKILIFLGYALLLSLFTLYSYLFIDPHFFYLHQWFTNFHQMHRFVTTSLFILFVMVLFGFYFSFLYLFKNHTFTKTHLFGLLGITCILLLSYPAVLSFDIFNYLATAKVTFFYKENPYIIMPIDLKGDSLLLYTRAANKIALYGPFWILLTAIPFLLGFGNVLLTLFTFKVFVAIFYIATSWLLWKITSSILKTAFFALNPLVILETFVSGHNDIVMMFFALASIYILFKKKLVWSGLLLFLSINIKYATGFLLPVFIGVFKDYYRHVSVDREKFFFMATVLLYCIFFLSAFREEIYPWYAIWFLLPSAFLFGKNLISTISLSFSFSLLLRYIPYMLLGTYTGPAPMIKIILTFVPVIIAILFYFLSQRRKISMYK